MTLRASTIQETLSTPSRIWMWMTTPWRLGLTCGCFALAWFLLSEVFIRVLLLPKWSYLVCGLVFALLIAVISFVFIRQLAEVTHPARGTTRQAENNYHAIFERFSAPMWLYDRHSLQIIKANGAATAIYGYSPEQFSKLSVADLYAPDEQDNILQKVGAAAPVHTMFLSGVKRHTLQNQQVRTVNVVCHENAFGSKSHGLLIAQDTNNYGAIEKKLNYQLKQLELAQQTALMSYWELNPSTQEISWSEHIHSLLGLAQNEVITRESFLSAIHPHDRDNVVQSHQMALGGEHITHEYRIVRPDGEPRHVLESVQLFSIPSESQNKVLLGTWMDITKWKTAEFTLARQQTMYQRMINSLPVGVLIIRNRHIHYSNSAANAMFGGSDDYSLEHIDLTHCIHPDHLTRELDRQDALQQGLISEQSFRYVRLLRLDGSEFEAEVTEIVFENAHQREIKLLVHDVSQSQQMRRDLEAANLRLKHLSQRLIEAQEVERRQIARDLHDDIGQQLTGFKLHLQRLTRKLESDDLKDIANVLSQGADEALTKVRSLSLSLHPLQLETLGLEAAVRWHLSQFLSATQTQWELQIEGSLIGISPKKAVVAFRIIQEAVNNVARHARATNVKVILNRGKGKLTVQIIDDGRGFNVSSAAGSAQSLGLTSMRERVASLEGELVVTSLKDVGTRITAILPAPPKSVMTEA